MEGWKGEYIVLFFLASLFLLFWPYFVLFRIRGSFGLFRVSVGLFGRFVFALVQGDFNQVKHFVGRR